MSRAVKLLDELDGSAQRRVADWILARTREHVAPAPTEPANGQMALLPD